MAPALGSRPLLVRTGLVIGLLGGALHVDWHLARPGPHRLSFDLAFHWLSAVPVFAFVTWYAARIWPRTPVAAAAALIAGGVFVGQVLEPGMEVVLLGQTWASVLRPLRVEAFLEFLGAGLMTSLLVVLWRLVRSGPPASTRPSA